RERVPNWGGRGQERLDLVDQLRGSDTGLRLDANQVELADASEQLLQRGHVEDGDGRAADGDAGKLHDADDSEPLHRPVLLDADRVAKPVVLARGGARVDRDLVRSVRPSPLGQLEWVEP